MSLTELRGNLPKKRKKLLGRGPGSGHGTYATRGGKGQTARAGGTRRPGFEGGQTPLSRQMPKMKGFKNPGKVSYTAINVSDLAKLFKETEIDLTKKSKKYKLLGDGEVEKAFSITVHKASKSAVEKIEKAGGEVKVTEPTKTKTEDPIKPVESIKE